MHLQRLGIQHLRNLDTDIPGLAKTNVFFGANGSGKTSVLEAIHLLGLGRSFRSTSARSVIAYEQPRLNVFAALVAGPRSVRLGVSRGREGDWQMRRDGEPVQALAEMARELPLLLVNSETFALLDGPPKQRRQYLDWGVFHVEPAFYPAWKTAIRCLKHRNKLLRHDKIRHDELSAWDAMLGEAAEQIQACRERYWNGLQGALTELCGELGVLPGLTMRYAPGWDVHQPYREVLVRQFDRDRAQRQTVSGPHRADLVFRLESLAAADTLSRGQKKMAILALRLAQARDLGCRGARPPLLLLDDLPAELDEEALRRVMRWIETQDNQVFITTVSPQPLGRAIKKTEDVRWFHVEHGAIKASSGAI